MAERNTMYERRGGVDGSHGQNFEWSVTTMAYLRCQRLYEQWKRNGQNGIKSFSVANNVDGAGNFDDVVVRVEHVVDGEIRNKLIFVQCKHAQDPTKKYKFQELLKDRMLGSYFKSFSEILQCREEIENELLKDEYESNPQYSNLEQSQNNLRCFLDCKNLEIEVIFYSNIVIETDRIGIFQCKKPSSMDSDITSQIFNISKSSSFELQANDTDFQNLKCESLLEGHENTKTLFCNNFRVFVNQSEDIENLIQNEIEMLTNTISDAESLRSCFVQEIKYHFGTQKFCKTLTEDVNLLQNIRNFMYVKKKGVNAVSKFQQNSVALNLFSEKAMENVEMLITAKSFVTIETEFQHFERLKILQYLKLKCDNFTFLLLHTNDDIEKWISARKTESYRKLPKVFICSEISLESTIDSFEPYESTIQILQSNKKESALTEYLDQFSLTTEKFILAAKISFQEVQVDIESFCGDKWRTTFNENMISDILDQKIINVCKNPIQSMDFYIARTLVTKTINSKNFLEKIRELSNCVTNVLFSERENCIPGHNTSFTTFESLEEAKSFIRACHCDQNDTYHLFSFRNTEMEFIYSFGKPSDLIEIKSVTEDSMIENSKNRVDVISDVAGMGKTSTLLSLSDKYKQNNPTHWVFFVELNKFLGKLEKVKNFESTQSALNFLGLTILNLKGIELEMFMNECNGTGKVALFFDAFDEISPDAEKIFPLLLLKLEETQVMKIVVSSRTNYVHVLEEALLCKSISFLGFTNDEKELALQGYWKKMLIEENKEFDEKALKQIVQKTVLSFLPWDGVLDDILAIPLQIRMIADVYYESLINEEENESHSLELNLSDLYENFIYSHARRSIVKKSKTYWNSQTKAQKKRYIEEKLNGAKELACMTILPDLFKPSNTDFKRVISTLCDDIGIVTNKEPVVFLHRTIAEFLAAKYLITDVFLNENDYDTMESLASVFVESKFVTLRKFLNSLLGNVSSLKSIQKMEQERIFGLPNSIHVAALEENIEILKFLTMHNESLLNVQNISGESPLHIACNNGKIEVVNFLLTKPDCYVNIKDTGGNTPLHIAATRGLRDIIDLLLKFSNDIQLNVQNEDGLTPLLCAYMRGKSEAAKLLLTHSACSIQLCGNDGDTILHDASKKGDIETMQLLLNRDNSLLKTQNIRGKMPLHYACDYGKLEAVKLLISITKYPLNICDNDGSTALHLASKCGYIEIIKTLLNRDNTLINIQNGKEETPLFVACSNGKTEVVKCLLTYSNCSVNIIDKNGYTAIHLALKKGYLKILKLLVNVDGVMVNEKNKEGRTPLHCALKIGRIDEAKALLSNKDCLVDISDDDGNTALHLAARNGFSEIIELILQRNNIVLNSQNNDGETPIFNASKNGKKDAVGLLLKYSECSLCICDKFDDTPLHYASYFGYTEIMKLLLRREDSLVNTQNEFGRTPLHDACANSKVEAVELLLTISDCSVNVLDNKRHTVLHDAVLKGNVNIIKMLLQRDIKLLNLQNFKERTPLHSACYNGNFDAVIYLLTFPECSVNLRDDEGNSVFHDATKRGRIDVMKALLERDVNLLTMKNFREEIPLFRACECGKFDAVKLLLSHADYSVNFCNIDGNTALHFAAFSGDTEIIKLLLQYESTLIDRKNIKGKSALHETCFRGNTEAVKFLLSCTDCPINICDENGNTILHDASFNNHTEIMKILLQCEYSLLNSQNLVGETPLHSACREGSSEAVKLLLSHSDCATNICTSKGETVLYFASSNGNTEIIKMLLKFDNSLLNKQTNRGSTPLHTACLSGRNEAVKFLVTQSVETINNCNKFGNTVLHCASYNGHTEILRFLLEIDTSMLNKQNKLGSTPLHCACHSKYQTETIKFLLSHSNCSVNILDNEGTTVFYYASLFGYTEILEILLQRNGDLINIPNKNGITPLYAACNNHQPEAAKFLLTQSICPPSVTICDNFGNTVLHEASSKGFTEVIELILKTDNTLLNMQNNGGETSLIVACKCNQIEAVKSLLAYTNCSVNILENDGNSALHCATKFGRTESLKIEFNDSTENIKMLLQRDNNLINKQNTNGSTPLHTACIYGSNKAVKLLLTYPNISVNICDNDGNTVLHDAACNARIEILEEILKTENSLLNMQNKEGKTPLYMACQKNKAHAVKLLLTYPNSLVNICDNDGNNVLHVATIKSYFQIIELILNTDSNLLNLQNKNGQTPLNYAVTTGAPMIQAIVKLISHPNFSINDTDALGQSIFEQFLQYRENDRKNND